MDTPLVNGTVYPYLDVEPKAYRFRILNAANDRFFNLQMYVADPAVTTADGRTDTEVKMVPAAATAGFPATWPTDGREGGVPDPATRGPEWIQIGTEGGFLPAPVVVPNQPIGWNLNQTNFNFGNVNEHSLLLGTAERADVIVDFSAYRRQDAHPLQRRAGGVPGARSALRLLHRAAWTRSAPAGPPRPSPATGPTPAPSCRSGSPAAAAGAYPLASLRNAFAKTASKRGVFEVSQDPIIVPQASYNSAYNGSFPADPFVRIHDGSKTFQNLMARRCPSPSSPRPSRTRWVKPSTRNTAG